MIIYSSLIIICSRMLRELLNLLKERKVKCADILTLGFLSLLKVLGVLQQARGQKSCFSQVECQRDVEINLLTATGRGLFHGQLNGGFIQQMLYCLTMGDHQFKSGCGLSSLRIYLSLVDENTSLCSVIENHLKPGPWNNQLKPFCKEPLQSLKFFIQKYPKGPRSPFVELDIEAPIREQLANLVIIEYPVIHVFLPSRHYDFEVIKAAICHKIDPKESTSHQEQSPRGGSFREEEIQEDDSSEPRVLDLMKHAKPDGIFQSSRQPKETMKELEDTLDSPLFAKVTQRPVKNVVCTGGAEDNQLLFSDQSGGSMEFEFEQELIDSYSDLKSKTNLEDFFDFEGLLQTDVDIWIVDIRKLIFTF